MSLNKSELFIRTITGILIVGFTLAAVIYSPFTYLLWLSLITLFGTREFLRLDQHTRDSIHTMWAPVAIAFLVGFTGWWIMQPGNPLFAFAIIPLILSCIVIFQFLRIQSPSELVLKSQAFYVAAIYIGLPMLSGCLFLFPKYSFHFILLPIILIWVNDVGAYLIGSLWGSRKIMPLISPGKSLQGTIGGGIIALLTGLGFMFIWPDLPRGYILTLGIATPFFALGGDLWESALKRNAGVKDSGNIFPGHGGVLDRYDSFIFVLPVAALAYFIFGL
jgi:phosphatidate cytidylyltransferase